MRAASRTAAVSILLALISPAGADARGGYSHHKDFDAEHGATADFLAVPCATFTQVCRSVVAVAIGADYWGCAPIRDQGVDENSASKAVYDWLRANKAASRSRWSADVKIAFRTVYPSCE